MSDYLERTNNGTSFSGSDTEIYQALVIASALRFYAKTKMQVNRHYTPTRMILAAESITGNRYKRGEYVKAADDLTAWADARKSQPKVGA